MKKILITFISIIFISCSVPDVEDLLPDIKYTEKAVFSPAAGTYDSAQNISITSETSDSLIYFTTDGSTPDKTTGTFYSSPIEVSETTIVKAVVYKDGLTESISSAEYKIQALSPVFTPPTGTYDEEQNVSINCETAGSQIYYTIDSSDPTGITGILYTDPISITSETVIKAVAFNTDLPNSDISEAEYKFCVKSPVCSPSGGIYNAGQTVTISCATADAEIYYTTDGRTPDNVSGIKYTGENIDIPINKTIKSIAYKTGLLASPVEEDIYILQPVTPQFTPPAGDFTSPQNVTISSETEGVSIYYTTDGTTPSEETGTLYTESINIMIDKELKAVAIKSGWSDSERVSGGFIIFPHYFLYKSNSSSMTACKINIYTGEIIEQVESSVTFTGSSCATDPFGRFLFGHSQYNLYSSKINPYTGALTGETTIESPGRVPIMTAVDQNGRYAYIPYQLDGGGVCALSIDQTTGALSHVSGSPYSAGGYPTIADFNPSKSILYVTNLASDNISAFNVNSSTGELSEITDSPFSTPMEQPGDIVFHPSGEYLYETSKFSSIIAVYSVNSSTGALTEKYLIDDTRGPFHIIIDPEGKYLFITNYEDDSISVYSISSSTGSISEISGSPFNAGSKPNGIVMDPAGKYLFVANQGDKNIYAYDINSSTGALSYKYTIEDSGLSVMIAEVPEP